MRRIEVEFPSADGTTTITGVVWRPEQAVEIKGVVVISHGLTEYMGRYKDLAYYLTSKGYLVGGIDQIGHGRSGKDMSLSPGGWKHLLDDFEQMALMIHETVPELPMILLGFAHGSFVVHQVLMRQPHFVDGAIIIGAGLQSSIILKGTQHMIKRDMRKNGRNAFSPFIDRLIHGNYNKHFQNEDSKYAWLSTDKEALAQYEKDPMNADFITGGYLMELLEGMIKSNLIMKKMSGRVHILMLSGGDDPLAHQGRALRKAKKAFRKSGVKDIQMKIYPGMRHDILHEKDHGKVYQDMEQWLDKVTRKK